MIGVIENLLEKLIKVLIGGGGGGGGGMTYTFTKVTRYRNR